MARTHTACEKLDLVSHGPLSDLGVLAGYPAAWFDVKYASYDTAVRLFTV